MLFFLAQNHFFIQEKDLRILGVSLESHIVHDDDEHLVLLRPVAVVLLLVDPVDPHNETPRISLHVLEVLLQNFLQLAVFVEGDRFDDQLFIFGFEIELSPLLVRVEQRLLELLCGTALNHLQTDRGNERIVRNSMDVSKASEHLGSDFNELAPVVLEFVELLHLNHVLHFEVVFGHHVDSRVLRGDFQYFGQSLHESQHHVPVRVF